MPKKAAPLNPDPNPVTIDIDAMLSEQIAGSNTTTLRFRGREWVIGELMDVPLSIMAQGRDVESQSLDEVVWLADMLTQSVTEDSREDFAALTLTMREAWAIFDVLVKAQQGVTPGESPAS